VITRVVRPLVVLCLPLALAFASQRPVVVRAQGSTDLLPLNVQFDNVLQPVATLLRRKSKTFERQCAVIAARRSLRVVVIATPPPRDLSGPRARSTITRHLYGALRVVIEIPITSGDLAELLGHEFEHVIEQIEGIDLTALARANAPDVLEVQEGVFETARARKAGLLVSQQSNADTDEPADAATPAGLLRAIHTPPTSLLRR
jgi:hypothetical protein